MRTQAASGIGKETALALAEAGVRAIALADINEQGALEAAQESRRYAKHASYRSLAIKVDIVDEESVQTIVDTTFREFGRIDFSVNSAGVSSSQETVPMLMCKHMMLMCNYRWEISPVLSHRISQSTFSTRQSKLTSRGPCFAFVLLPKSWLTRGR